MNLAKTITSTSRDLGSNAYDLASNVGSRSFDLAKSFGAGTADLAKQIGWKRGLIGLAAIAGATFGTIMIVRFFKARSAEAASEGEESVAEGGARFVPKHKKNKPFVAHH